MKFTAPVLVATVAATVAAEAAPQVDLNLIMADLADSGVLTQAQKAYDDNKDKINELLSQVDTLKLMDLVQQLGLGGPMMKLMFNGGLSALFPQTEKREANPLMDIMMQGMFGGNQKRDTGSDIGADIANAVMGAMFKRDDTAAGGDGDDTAEAAATTIASTLTDPAIIEATDLFSLLVGTAPAPSAAEPSSLAGGNVLDDLFGDVVGPNPTTSGTNGSAEATASTGSGSLLDDLFGDLFDSSPSNSTLTPKDTTDSSSDSGSDNFFGDLLDLIFGTSSDSSSTPQSSTTSSSSGGSLIDEIIGLVGDVLSSLFAHSGDWISELLEDLFGGSSLGTLASGDFSFGSLIGGIFELIIDSLFGGLLLSGTSLTTANSVFGSNAKKCCCSPKFKAKRNQQKRMLKKIVQAKVSHNMAKRDVLVAKRDTLARRMVADALMKRMAEL